MNATAVHTSGAVVLGQEERFNSGISEKAAATQGDMVAVKLLAPAAVATPAGGPFFQVTRFLRTLGDQLFGAPAADREVIEASDSDYSSYVPCCCC